MGRVGSAFRSTGCGAIVLRRKFPMRNPAKILPLIVLMVYSSVSPGQAAGPSLQVPTLPDNADK